MKRMKLAVIAIFAMGLSVGCGSSSDSSYQTSDNMRERFSFLTDALVSTGNSTTACIQAGTGNSYTIHTTFEHQSNPFTGAVPSVTLMELDINEYRKSGCPGTPSAVIPHQYILLIGEEINQGTRLEIGVLRNTFNLEFDDLHKFVEMILFGTTIDPGETFYTTIVGQGGLQTDSLKYGFANADEGHSGITPDFRANDVSKYTSGNTFLLQK